MRVTSPALGVVAGGLALAAVAIAPAGADARIVRAQDEHGRPITFDVRPSGVDVADYAAVLREAAHGDEIRTVTVRIVERGQIASACGTIEAVACYSGNGRRGRIVVRAGSRGDVEHSLLHEYAHHVDAAIPNAGRPELNGTPRWWRARSMGTRLQRGQVAYGYRRGWARSIGEIFAEDYVQVQIRSCYGIPWLRPPSEAVRRAIRQDVTGRPTGPEPREAVGEGSAGPTDPPASARSRTFRHRAEIGVGEVARVRFGLLGPAGGSTSRRRSRAPTAWAGSPRSSTAGGAGSRAARGRMGRRRGSSGGTCRGARARSGWATSARAPSRSRRP